MKKKGAPLIAGGGGSRPAGFARGFKAPPKTDMIDALLLAGDDDDEDEDQSEQDSELRNDGKPAKIIQNDKNRAGAIDRRKSEQNFPSRDATKNQQQKGNAY